ncbi:hypothetical protein ACFQV8_34150 [Pseudonocardia benzenivorans]
MAATRWVSAAGGAPSTVTSSHTTVVAEPGIGVPTVVGSAVPSSPVSPPTRLLEAASAGPLNESSTFREPASRTSTSSSRSGAGLALVSSSS